MVVTSSIRARTHRNHPSCVRNQYLRKLDTKQNSLRLDVDTFLCR